MIPSRIELLILALLAPRLNQLGQGIIFLNVAEGRLEYVLFCAEYNAT
jgi:hypothetical protein